LLKLVRNSGDFDVSHHSLAMSAPYDLHGLARAHPAGVHWPQDASSKKRRALSAGAVVIG